MKRKILIIFLNIICVCTICLAHSGRTDSYGGHHDRSDGTYHYHSGPYAHTGDYTGPIEEGGVKINSNSNNVNSTNNNINTNKNNSTTTKRKNTNNTNSNKTNEFFSTKKIKKKINKDRIIIITIILMSIVLIKTNPYKKK